MLTSERLAAGLSEVWTVVGLAAEEVDLVLVEVVDGRAPWWSPESRLGERPPLVVWATSGPPAPEFADLVAEASAVYVADADQLAAWQRVAPSAKLLAPAASSRVRPVRGEDRRPEVAVAASGPTAAAVAGPVSTVLARAVRALEEQLVVRHHAPSPEAPASRLPKLLSRAVRPASYAELQDVLGQAAVLLDGPRRHPHDTWAVLDAAAAATPVVTLPGLPAPLAGLPAPDTEQALRSELVARLHQPELRDREGLRLRREVLAEHTWAHRAGLITAEVAIFVPRGGNPATVSAVVPTNRPHQVDNVLANLGRQSHERTELVLVLHGLDLDRDDLAKRAAEAGVGHLVVVDAPGTATLGACMNLGVDAASGEYVAKMDDDNHYGRHYLSDLLHGFETSGAGIVGKWAHYVWLQSTGAVVLRHADAEHSYVRRIQGGSMLFEGDLVRRLRFSDIPRAVDSDILDRALAEGVKVWSSDRFNYVSVRGVDRTAHTWTVGDATFLTASGRLEFYGDPRAHVEV